MTRIDHSIINKTLLLERVTIMKTDFLNSTRKHQLINRLCFLLLASITFSCQGDFEGKKSNNIAMEPRELLFEPGSIGTREATDTIEIRNTGEASLELADIYIEVDSEVDGEAGRERLDACDIEIQMLPPETILTPDVMPTCTLILRERPALPVTLEPGQLKQLSITYRPLDGVTTPLNPELVVESNASNGRRITSSLTVGGGLPDISSNIRAIQFASSGMNRENYLLRNLGSSPLVLNGLDVILNDPDNYPAPEGGTIEFSVDSTEEFVGASIEPGGYLRLIVTYDPQDEGVDQAKMIISSNDPDEPRFEVLLTSEAVPANLAIMPSPLVFNHENMMIDTQPITFLNTGLRPISAFLSIEQAGENFRINAADNDSFQLQAGDSQIIRVDYVAGNMPAEATLVVRSDDADNAIDGEFRIPLRTSLSNSLKLLDVDTSTVSFDSVAAGESSTVSITITSAGDSPVTLSETMIEGSDLDISTFSVSEPSPGAIAPGDSQTLDVTFTRPADEMAPLAYQANLVIRSDSDGGDIVVTLVANP